MLGQHLGALESEYEALREEFRAVTDDLEAMVKENQVEDLNWEAEGLAGDIPSSMLQWPNAACMS